MTVHIGIAGNNTAVLVSDSQGSTSSSKFGGWQKQFHGPDFILGVAGAGYVLEGLFQHLHSLDDITASTLADSVTHFLNSEIVPHRRGEAEFIALLSGLPIQLKTFQPDVFCNFAPHRQFTSIGSGSTYVHDAMHGVGAGSWHGYFPQSLPQQLSYALYLADAADSSLTVNDSITVGLICNGKTYLLADQDIQPSYVSQTIRDNWSWITESSNEIFDAARTAIGEIEAAHRVFSGIWSGTLSTENGAMLLIHNDQIASHLSNLAILVDNYCAEYDSHMNRD